MAVWRSDKPDITETCSAGIQYTEENFQYIHDLMNRFAAYFDGANMAAGWDDTNPENLYFRGPLLQFAASPGTAFPGGGPNFREGDIYWNTFEKILYCYDAVAATFVTAAPGIVPVVPTQASAIAVWNDTTGAALRDSNVYVDATGNVQATNIVNFAKVAVLDSFIRNVIDGDISGIWFFDEYNTGASNSDRTPDSSHTPHNLTFWSKAFAAKTGANMNPYVLNGIARAQNIGGSASTFWAEPNGAAADLSFGDGVTTDASFSFVMAVRVLSSGDGRYICGKYNNAQNNREYIMYLSQPAAIAHLSVTLYDSVAANQITTTALDTDFAIIAPGQPFIVIGITRDPAGAGNGINIYIDGIQETTADGGAGVYQAMHPTGATFGCFHENAGYQFNDWEWVFLSAVKGHAIGAERMKIISDVLHGYMGLDLV